MKILQIVAALFLLQSCVYKPIGFHSTSVPPAPDYSLALNWAALPGSDDMADRVPIGGLADRQNEAQVDVFFLHPTTFVGKRSGWNASVGDEKLNEKTEQTTILYQASIFNGAGRVYAPRYRQVSLPSFRSGDQASIDAALDVAYSDVKKAFQYYLEHYNQKRPIILAAHSQGAFHAKRLLKEFFDGKALQNKLVVAYVVGWYVLEDDFKYLPPCETPEQTGCICSWRTAKFGHVPPGYLIGDSIVVTNPLSWNMDVDPVPKDRNKGAVLRDFNKVLPQIVDAQINNGMLWSHKPRFPGSFLFSRKDYHIADFNFFYVDVRENAQLRVGAFWK